MVVDISGFQYTKGCLPPPREMRALKRERMHWKTLFSALQLPILNSWAKVSTKGTLKTTRSIMRSLELWVCHRCDHIEWWHYGNLLPGLLLLQNKHPFLISFLSQKPKTIALSKLHYISKIKGVRCDCIDLWDCGNLFPLLLLFQNTFPKSTLF